MNYLYCRDKIFPNVILFLTRNVTLKSVSASRAMSSLIYWVERQLIPF